MENMKCVECGLDKELKADNFYWRNDLQKWRHVCKTCISLDRQKRYNQKSDEIKEKVAIYREANRSVINDKAVIYNNKEETKKRVVKWRQKNKKILRQKEKEWILNNPEKYKEIVRKKSKKQSQKPSYKIKHSISLSVNYALHKSGNSKQGSSVIKYLPYTIQELKVYLEKQFESWMTWKNYGVYHHAVWNDNDSSTWTWHIDHIIPQSTLPYTSMADDNFKKCWALSNLRPLSAKQNVLDGANRTRHK